MGYGNKAGNCLPVILECTWWFPSWKRMGKHQIGGAEELRAPRYKPFLLPEQFLAQSLCALRLFLRKKVAGSSLHKVFWQWQPVPCWCPPQACTHFTEGDVPCLSIAPLLSRSTTLTVCALHTQVVCVQ